MNIYREDWGENMECSGVDVRESSFFVHDSDRWLAKMPSRSKCLLPERQEKNINVDLADVRSSREPQQCGWCDC